MDRPGTYDDITEALRKLLSVISGLQDIAKQQNLMLLDLYERIVKLEVKNGILEHDSPSN